jgi:hypothetical protein
MPDAAALDGLLSREPSRWRGFERLPVETALARYPLSASEGAAMLGERPVAYRFRTLARPPGGHPFFFYFAQGRLACISTDYWSLDPAECATILAELGRPPHRLDAVFRDSIMPEADWVFAERGLALCVVPETGLIARRAAYPPCDLATYRDLYRPVETAREWNEPQA